MKDAAVFDLESETVSNTDYRRVLHTGNEQLVIMSVPVGDDIHKETHPDLDQFIRVEQGEGVLRITAGGEVSEHPLRDGVAVIIPAGAEHEVRNSSATQPLKLYTVYIPVIPGARPRFEHRPRTVQRFNPDKRSKTDANAVLKGTRALATP